MAYGTIKVDTITFTDAGVDKSVTISGLVQNPTFSGNITVTGTVSGNTIQGQTVSGATITGGAAAFTTVTGGVATITSGVFALGSASNPSISFNGDANSGLYSPGADQVAVATNGTGRLFINSTGSVGIGAALTYSSHFPNATVYNNQGVFFADGSLNYYRTGFGNNVLPSGPDSYINMKSRGWGLFSITDDVLSYSSGPTGTAGSGINGSERLRITSAGLVGIGTSSPIDKLHVDGRIAVTTDSSTPTTGEAFFYKSASGAVMSGFGATIETGGAGSRQARVSVDSSGNVGIGTTGPGEKLHVSGGKIKLTGAAGGGAGGGILSGEVAGELHIQSEDYTGASFADIVFDAGNGSGSYTERARIDSNGRLLVGTSSARGSAGVTGQFQLEGTTYNNSSVNLINNGNDNQPPYLVFGKSRSNSVGGSTIIQSGDYLGRIDFAGADGTDLASTGAWIGAIVDGTPGANDLPTRLVFSTTADGASSPTERMRITSGGNVGIGTTSPSSLLELSGVSNPQITLDGTTTSGYRGLIFAYDGTGFGQIGQNVQSGELIIRSGESGQSGYFINFSVNGSDAARIDSSGRLGIGTSVPGSYNSNANTLVVGNTSSNQGITISAGTASASAIHFADGTTGDEAYRGILKYEHSNDRFLFGTAGGNTALTIDSSQRVGIGTTSPRGRLEVSDGTSNTAGEAINEAYIVGASTGSSEGILTIQSNDAMISDKGGSIAFGGRAGTGSSAGANWAFINGYKENGVSGNYGGYLSFVTRPNAGAISERARIDSSGRLLVGTSTARSPLTHQSRLQVEGTDYSGSTLSIISNSSGADGPTLLLGKSRAGSLNGNAVVQNGDDLGQIYFLGADGSDLDGRAATIKAQVDGTPGADDMPGRLVFSTTADGASSPTERMRITQAGLVMINGTTATAATQPVVFQVGESTDYFHIQRSGPNSVIETQVSVSTTAPRNIFAFRNPNGFTGYIQISGTSTSFLTSSDYRLKENVTAVTDGISRLQRLKPSRFNFIADPNTTVDGFLAHEVQAIVPEAISGIKDEVDADGNPKYQGIDQSKLVPLLVAALQEAIGRIETLEGMVAVNNITIDEQQHQLSTLAARLTALESA